MKVIEFLNYVVERPKLYKVNKVEDIDLLILGFDVGSKGQAYLFIEDFEKFVRKRYRSTKYRWWQLIRLHSADDSNSIELFKLIFAEYKAK